jgi:uncharacterized protein (TIGR02996 family)
VTDDEAFVRRIVDSPWDDTPRLVYADWLDERDDPRGKYLRAEAAWPKGINKKPIGWRDLLEGLDLVWVYRVTRPPTGVCCDHVRFAESMPITATAIQDVEQRLRISLPPEYQAFLLNYNGGRPRSVERCELNDWIDDFFPVGEFVSVPGLVDDTERLLRYGRQGNGANELIADFIPIATGNLGSDIYFLTVKCKQFENPFAGKSIGNVFVFRDFMDDPLTP